MARIQFPMSQARLLKCFKRVSFVLSTIVFFILAAIHGSPLRAQDAPQGPVAPPPEHHVTRIGNESEPEAPPSLPEAEIVKSFSQKEDQYILWRTRYTYRKTIRIQEFGADGKPSGEFVLVTQPGRDAEGKLFEKVVEKPRSTLQHLFLRAEDLDSLQRIPAFPLTSSQLSKYDLKYLGKEQVDEVDCYIFQAKPRVVERIKAYFDGIVWVDAKYLEVVKTYGKWVTDQGDVHTIADLPFTLFETYRENVDGKYWFPSYSRSDDTLNLKGLEIPVRIVIKWTDFKPVPSAPQTSSPSTPTTPPKP
ncbi:MAG: hypothetical protein DMG52_01630 [Acidobacteria bacterium]|nr:MAG: hypothetical protein DMG55_21355 [Acidobacteriota bacterium]PYU77167.1 MAG: hypothetical protein DMG52_01630 [Acidobacteriota bacterium]